MWPCTTGEDGGPPWRVVALKQRGQREQQPRCSPASDRSANTLPASEWCGCQQVWPQVSGSGRVARGDGRECARTLTPSLPTTSRHRGCQLPSIAARCGSCTFIRRRLLLLHTRKSSLLIPPPLSPASHHNARVALPPPLHVAPELIQRSWQTASHAPPAELDLRPRGICESAVACTALY